MQKKELSLAERFLNFLCNWISENRVPFLSSVFFGLLAYAFAFTNKLPNHDDVMYLFGKGATADSGRWGLEVLRLLIPDYSLPWLHGIVSLLLLSVAICLILKLAGLKNILAQVLLPALIICFPSQIGTFCYMYTSSCYAVAFLLSVLAVREAVRPGVLSKLASVLCVVLMLSIYQAYLSITAGLMVLLLIRKLLAAEPGEPGGKYTLCLQVVREGVLDLLLLAAALVLYFASVRLYQKLTGVAYNGYSNELRMYAPGFPQGIPVAYQMFLFNLTSRYNMLVVSKTSRLMHFFAFLAAGAGIVLHLIRRKNWSETILLAFLLLMLPLCICGMYIVIYWSGIHTLVLFGYILLYVLVFITLETLPLPASGIPAKGMRDIAAVTLAVVVGINVCYANRTFLKLHLAYENAQALMTAVTAQIRMQPGYYSNAPVAMYPSAGAALKFSEGFGTEEELAHDIAGAQFQLLTGFTEQAFLENYIGTEINLLTRDEMDRLVATEEVKTMPVYPDSGSIRNISGVWFIKFAEVPEDSGEMFVYHNSPFE